MKHWGVSITDGDGIVHNWSVSANSKYAALVTVLESWNSDLYGMPYGIEKGGITRVSVREQDMSFTVWG